MSINRFFCEGLHAALDLKFHILLIIYFIGSVSKENRLMVHFETFKIQDMTV